MILNVIGSTHNQLPVLILGPFIIIIGALLLWNAVKDPGGRMSNWYELNKDWRVAFWAISKDARQFRIWHGVIGIVFVIGGVVAVVSVV